jgi:hypothetical protein
MWVVVIFCLIVVNTYIFLIIIWFIIAAIINPEKYLPFASMATTFIAVISNIVASQMAIAKNGINTLNEIIVESKIEHITEIVEKVKAGNIKHDGTSSSDLRRIADIGYKLKLLDEEQYNIIDQNAEIIIRDPVRAGEELGRFYKTIADNPGSYVKKMQVKKKKKKKKKIILISNLKFKLYKIKL